MKGLLIGMVMVLPLSGCSGEVPVIQEDNGEMVVSMVQENGDSYIAKAHEVSNEVMKLTTEIINNGKEMVQSPENQQMVKEKSRYLLHELSELKKRAMKENKDSVFTKDLAHVQKQFNEFLVAYDANDGKVDEEVVKGLEETNEGKRQLDKTLEEMAKFSKAEASE